MSTASSCTHAVYYKAISRDINQPPPKGCTKAPSALYNPYRKWRDPPAFVFSLSLRVFVSLSRWRTKGPYLPSCYIHTEREKGAKLLPRCAFYVFRPRVPLCRGRSIDRSAMLRSVFPTYTSPPTHTHTEEVSYTTRISPGFSIQAVSDSTLIMHVIARADTNIYIYTIAAAAIAAFQ